MKVLIVASYNRGRFSPFVLEQVNALKAKNVSFDFFGIKSKGVIGYIYSLKLLKKQIKNFKPDLIHAHYGLSGLLANLQRKISVVTTYHGSDIHSGGLLLKLSRLSMKLSKYNIFVSNKLLELANYQKKNAAVQACGVDFDKFMMLPKEAARKQLGLDLSDKLVLFAGAFDNEIKNPELAQQACKLLPECKLIELKGYRREEVNLLMNACDCLLMTSHREASPMVIKEVMMCGTPEYIKEGENGFFTTNRRIEEVGDLIIDLINKPEERKKIGDNAIKTIQVMFTLEHMGSEIENIYKKLLK
jgi:glycosyltransferase involved in cell wall biosynthesis